jgi:vancomycin resistance protein YoaR
MKTIALLKNTLFFASLLLVQSAAGILGTAVALEHKYNGIIQQGVNVAGIQVGGLSTAQAAEKLERSLPPPDESTFEVRDGAKSFSFKLSDIDARYDCRSMAATAFKYGINDQYVMQLTSLLKRRAAPADVPAKIIFSEDKLATIIQTLKTNWDSPPKNASLNVSNKRMEIAEGKAGYRLDSDETFKQVRLAMSEGRLQARAAGQLLEPDVKIADLSIIDALLAEYVTVFDENDRNRSHNIALASAAINGALVKPGEIFSLNRRLGPRVAENGYLKAPIFIQSQLALDFGGGICQVATTLYNAALLANLGIVERYSHPLPVNYVSPGRDATIAGDYLDLKFLNNTGAPVYIFSNIESGTLTVGILGAKTVEPGEVRITVDQSVIQPQVVLQYDPSLPTGETRVRNQGKTGYTVRVYREIVVDGVVKTRTLISSDYFGPSDTVLLVGPKPEGTEK